MHFLSYDEKKHAELLANYCLYTKAGERILLNGSIEAMPLLSALYREILRLGARPVLRVNYAEQDEDTIDFASDDILDKVHEAEVEDMRSFDGFCRVLSPALTRPVDPVRRARLMAGRRELLEARSGKKWSLSLYPSVQAARQAEMSQEAFGDFVMRAMFLDKVDPIAEWGKIRQLQDGLIERLSRADEVHIQADNTDIKLRVAGRRWANSDGKRNMPSGEVFTGPLESSANGYITFDIPALYNGVVVSGVYLEFKDGQVVKASAEQGESTLLAALDTDAGAKFLGELGIGSNFGIQRPTRNILFDEKIGGTVHLALGKSYPETGGLNKSAIHWDLICDLRNGGSISLDGEVWQENGTFV